jgi:hypothetical protein
MATGLHNTAEKNKQQVVYRMEERVKDYMTSLLFFVY